MPDRINKVNKLIKEEFGKILFQEMEFEKGVLVTITGVDTSVDLKYTKILISVLPFEKSEEAIEILNKNIYGLQQILNKRLKMRSVPRVEFKIDSAGKQMEKIDNILEKIN